MTANRMRSVGDSGKSLRGGATGSLCVCCVVMGVSGVKGRAGMKERAGAFRKEAEGTLTGTVGVFERRSASAERVETASSTDMDVWGGVVDEGTSTALAVSRKSSGVAEESGLGERAGGTAPSRVLAEADVILSGVGREGTVARCGTVCL